MRSTPVLDTGAFGQPPSGQAGSSSRAATGDPRLRTIEGVKPEKRKSSEQPDGRSTKRIRQHQHDARSLICNDCHRDNKTCDGRGQCSECISNRRTCEYRRCGYSPCSKQDCGRYHSGQIAAGRSGYEIPDPRQSHSKTEKTLKEKQYVGSSRKLQQMCKQQKSASTAYFDQDALPVVHPPTLLKYED
ncbi:hypothetical protein CLAFUW4_03295 [Fulvia fulva]|uniref:Uncharacterized protein n=1 Tax=Passalora fulva TaxID=5499 RepID=A0A9Q8P533_PASFU|nr:uncharacterized protein CLAFUR5_03276 [Fulvia fulva]KAK4631139.1 hypothetical protein CLAFUR4_03284 [Fulvia fulva]KAK4632991.1 hypothetical protein CLAFUR0_03288 [Fulvia fulva]UJO13588.1 hypothetical protein CLAFUR5_03276 [Fulvia fulva]WPV10519.1 hypothetical protein CLAFUW4_03295 [Fulvia fulva]WPV25493.1 hypothetical protein CLAFUW7_03287 [Fulvia fulva]